MKFLQLLLIMGVMPLAGCAGTWDGHYVPWAEDAPSQNYILFFAVNSVELDEMAQGVVAQTAADALRLQPTRIVLSGLTGAEDAAPVSPEIANQRFTAVEQAMVAEGVDSSLFGRAELAVDPNLPDTALHRVEIHFDLP